jgi:hypothetical protein
MEEIQIKLDYSLKLPEERKALVEKIVSQAPSTQLTPKYLEILSNYILDAAMTKEEKKKKKILTDNRMVTIDKRETSYEELVSKFENGEDGVYNLINEDKNQYLEQKAEITEEDIAEIPGLRDLRERIQSIEAQAKKAVGKKKYLLMKQAIEMRQEQYLLKDMFRSPVRAHYASHTGGNRIDLDEVVYFDANGEPTSDALVTFFKQDHVSAILCNYENLKEHLGHKFSNDFYYLLEDFDKLKDKALAPYPAYAAIVKGKVTGLTNAQIQEILEKEYGVKHTVEYISSLWRNKIPKIICEKAKDDYLIWYYSNIEYGTWKRCSRCGEYKLAHNRFFSKNNTSKDGFYSVCKACRNAKNKEK